MKNLLEHAPETHGGLTRWSQLKAITADLSGDACPVADKRYQAGESQQTRLEAELRCQKLLTHFRCQGQAVLGFT